ncbi:aminoglycoside phosphotransferase family protein [Streptomyces palmae]|uniref:Aminoglycoside phosphotransferase family protein n=1 Tax=Streptomyces palmae TaxID=1701085 RepID=A0A4Z0HDZ6_9ACTN|nr:aminoglycoside phosphotransferase family protein [Streptomyces palmae]TGB16462.1 aminoglycoside phosphotransferase family protein [Streptomyces palmae]
MTPRSPRAERAIALAVEAGRRLGLRADRPRVLHDVFSVLVHLAPDPVVVRVPALAVGTPAELAEKQRRELAVAGWLADAGAPVVGPSPLVPREPVAADGTSLTFWEFVNETDPLGELSQADPKALEDRFAEQTGWAAELHAALADYPGDLPVLSPLVPAIGPALAELRKAPQSLTAADLDRADREYAALEALVADFPARFPQARLQPLHGDSPAYNLLRTADGHRFSDFEDVTRGPIEWDLTFAGPRGIAAYERAGGTRVDRELLDLMEGARLLQGLSALTVVPKVPELGPMLAPMIGQWRARTPLELR